MKIDKDWFMEEVDQEIPPISPNFSKIYKCLIWIFTPKILCYVGLATFSNIWFGEIRVQLRQLTLVASLAKLGKGDIF